MNHDGFMFYQFKTCFCEFKSIDDTLCLIYSKEENLISYDLVKNQVINSINKNNSSNDIRHYLDNQFKRDLILNSFAFKNEIEVSNFKNWQVLLKLSHVNSGGLLFSSCFFNDNNNIYILTSNNKVTYSSKSECIKVFDMKKNKIKEIKNSNEDTFYIENYYDSKLEKNFIVTCNHGHINFYDFQSNSLFKQYKSDIPYQIINDFVVDDRGANKIILGTSYSGIKMWNFDTGELLKKTISHLENMYGLCLFNQNYLLAGTNTNYNDPNSFIVLIDLSNEKIIKRINTKLIGQSITCIKAIDMKNGKFFICGGRWSKIVLLENKGNEFNIKTTIY